MKHQTSPVQHRRLSRILRTRYGLQVGIHQLEAMDALPAGHRDTVFHFVVSPPNTEEGHVVDLPASSVMSGRPPLPRTDIKAVSPLRRTSWKPQQSRRSRQSSYIAEVREKAPNAYTAWTDEEEQRLIYMVASGQSIDAIASNLGRQPGAIRSRSRKLGLEVWC